jgi:DNA-binding transcriptional ArsR family regulator
MHAFDVLGDPVRRRIIKLLSDGEQASGDIVSVIAREFGLSQPAVSYQLKILRENGFATVRPEAQRRLYALKRDSFDDVDAWLEPFRRVWDNKLDALSTEIARGKRQRRLNKEEGKE